MTAENPHIGSTFESWLDEKGIREEATQENGKGADMDASLDFGALFERMAAEEQNQHHAVLGGIDVPLVRVEGGAAGRWDRHHDTPETVIVWSGAFDVAFRDHTLSLTSGQCCVVPLGADHQGTSPTGAEVILFKSGPAGS